VLEFFFFSEHVALFNFSPAWKQNKDRKKLEKNGPANRVQFYHQTIIIVIIGDPWEPLALYFLMKLCMKRSTSLIDARTRVNLPEIPGDPLSIYINANFIKVRYICLITIIIII